MKYTPLKCQERMTNVLVNVPRCGAFIRMGVGKTVAALTAISIMMYDMFAIKRVLIVAPLRVATLTWPDEIAKWSHTRHLTYVVLHGDSKVEDLVDAVNQDIILINYEGLIWLSRHKHLMQKIDLVLLDESTFIKNPTATRTKKIHDLTRDIPRRVIMTGSPTPNGLEGMWSQMFIVDRGAALKTSITAFRQKWFYKSHDGFSWKPKKESRKEILNRVRNKVIVVEDDENVGLPDIKQNIIKVELPPDIRKNYDELEAGFITSLKGVEDLEVLNKQSQSQKLRQILSGFVYREDKSVVRLHTEKLKALKELQTSLSGQNLFVAIQYQEDVDMIRDYFKKDIPYINGTTSKANDTKVLRRWIDGKIPMLLAHTASIAHGLNLQSGGFNVVWYSLTWSLEEWEQFIARLRRRGQISATIFNHIIAVANSIDMDMLSALENKDKYQEEVIEFFKKSILNRLTNR